MSTAERENVARFSERLLALEAAFGGEGSVDVAWMVVREPRISQVEPSSVMQRLYEMKMAQGGSITDILAAVESQPGLLLEGASPDASEAAEGQVAAWREGQATDNDTEWGRRYAQLLDYGREHGDVHVGFRDDDDEGLARWAATQRRALSRGALDAARRQQLEDAGFEFSEEAAEWMRWYSYVREASLESPEDTGLSSMLSDVGKSENYYAQNWQAVQRVARRNGRLSQERIELLDEIRFDWTGADPLS
ncbi:unnamed protein product [Pedinophyceae sp. YPF-701]|nr:unnamed protein product [Pedinophyceae sp. YPF-701]